MQKRALLALLLAMMMFLTGCTLIVRDEAVDNARVILRLGDDVYTKGEVEEQVDMQLQYTQMMYSMYYGYAINTSDPAIIADAQEMVIESLSRQLVMTAKARELGLDQLTEDETAQLEQAVQTTWQEYRDSIELELTLDENATEEQIEAAIDEVCAAEGVNLDVVRQSEMVNLLNEKLQAYAIKDVTVSEDALTAAFNSEVETAKSTYASNLSAYGAAVLNGEPVYYRPAGYRNVKQILIQFHDEDAALIDEINSALDNAERADNEYTAALAVQGVPSVEELISQVQVTLEEVSAPTAQATVKEVVTSFSEETEAEISDNAIKAAEARALRAFYTEQLAYAKLQARVNIDPEADDVLTRLAAGEDWDALAAQYNDDPGMMEGAATAETGYPVCEGFAQFDPAFVTAAMSIESVGGWSDKTPGSYGYYIIQYTSDVPEGPVDIESVRAALTDDLLATLQDQAYEAALASWISAADVQVDRNALND
ncbi:MAG: hypothetical protein IJZ74_12650 [Clostridia bacterium]|nr:hypothetical protein [Clostridia bacterium]